MLLMVINYSMDYCFLNNVLICYLSYLATGSDVFMQEASTLPCIY